LVGCKQNVSCPLTPITKGGLGAFYGENQIAFCVNLDTPSLFLPQNI